MAGTPAAPSASISTERSQVLENRRALRKAKKLKGKQFKEQKKNEREAKKQAILTKIREKREAERVAKETKENGQGCWLCGESDHQKSHCPNRGASDLTKTCFQCRRRGHTSHNCPDKDGGFSTSQTNSSAMCFNCGSTQHNLRDCPEPRVNGGATYATCFVCHQTGHLSSRCPKSTTGIYPKGGCCKLCKSVEHLARDCPMGKITINATPSNKKTTFADDEDEEVEKGGGDALDTFQLSDTEENESISKKRKDVHRTSHTKRVKF